MAEILILQETPGRMKPLRSSLQCYHQLHFVNSVTDAIKLLHAEKIDLIVSTVHLDNSNVFEFMQLVKHDPEICEIPFLCLSDEDTDISRFLDEGLEHAALICGADKYLVLDRFFGNGAYDFDSLRQMIEGCIAHGHSNDAPNILS